jgi:hypothetical protein
MKYVLTVIALAALLWAGSFVRAAVRTFRTGAPFTLQGHRDGAFPAQARFGRIGAVLITAFVVVIAVMVAQIAVAAWRE